MNILHTVEFYHPSIGGAQEVIKQISEKLAAQGHHVTVATSRLQNRSSLLVNGVYIEEFDIHGNAVNGFDGEVERYQTFLKQGDFDLIVNYAAQQWTTDLAFPILDQLRYKKILIPCGFSRLYSPEYSEYFKEMPDVLRKYDRLVFHANDYRDTNFARQHGLTNITLIPNGASLAEFEQAETTFRRRYGIGEHDLVLLTVGSHTGIKGHQLALVAYRQLKTKNAVLVIIGNKPAPKNWKLHFLKPLFSPFKHIFQSPRKLSLIPFMNSLKLLMKVLIGGIGPGCFPDCKAGSRWINLSSMGRKRVILLDASRAEVLEAYHAADLFIFGSNIEYSPLVLFEAMASKTPFLSLACGNAAEIAQWSGGGLIAPTVQKGNGMVDGDPFVFAHTIDELLQNHSRLQALGQAGYQSWRERFTWEKIALQYETLYEELIG